MAINDLFYPKSIAIVGASRKEKTVGNDILKNLVQQGYKGEIYPVNPKADILYNKKVFHDISEIKNSVDLAIIAIPSKFTPYIIEEMAINNKLKAAIVISAGFKEVGNIELEKQLKQTADKYNVSLLGPNCLGVLNPSINMNASFASVLPKKGNIAFISQSGALCTAILDYSTKINIGFSKFVSIGNKAQIDEISLINYFFEDNETKVIGIYSEDLKNAKELIKIVRQNLHSDNPKPIVILKSGKTELGQAAISSHTGSLSAGDNAYNALFNQAGIIRADTIEDMFNFLKIFSSNGIKKVANTVIVTNAGGPGVITIDTAFLSGLNLYKMPDDLKKELYSFLPPAASVKNPVDILGDATPERYEKTILTLLKHDDIDSLIVVLTPQSMTDPTSVAQKIVDIRKQYKDKSIVVAFIGHEEVKNATSILQQENIDIYTFPEHATVSLAQIKKLYQKTKQTHSFSEINIEINKDEIQQKIKTYINNGIFELPEAEANTLLKLYNIPLLPSKIAKTKQEALEIVKQFKTKCVFKIVSKDILHKSDAGGVILNVDTNNAEQSFDKIIENVKAYKKDASIEGIFIAPMAPKGMEMIVGINKIEKLGHVLIVGLGGIFVEIFKDISLGFSPLSDQDIENMIKNLKSYKLLNGARGQNKKDINAIKKIVKILDKMVQDFPNIKELDINPLLVLDEGQGAIALDSRIILEKQ